MTAMSIFDKFGIPTRFIIQSVLLPLTLNNVIKQRIKKPSDNEKSVKVFNYPYHTFE